MKDELLLSQLEDLATKLGITIRHFKFIRDESSGRGGLCRIRGEYVLFVDSQATARDKILVTIEALKQFDLGEIQVMPVIRELLDGPKK
ncbi:MAG: hypothetical protein HY787_12945 [Deltaproteobacteria bacterium]|nr:hypothetical protein [Deltaproteobacteria bacterium]